jgi:integrase/recombinase XerD
VELSNATDDPIRIDEVCLSGLWCRARCLGLFAVRRADIESFARDLEAKGRAQATVTRRLSTIAGFYRYAVEDELLDHSPAAHVRRPRVDYESHAAALDRNELGALLVAAGLGPPAEHALISLLALNGLRVSEATGADIDHLGLERGHRTLTITRKGGKVFTIPLAPRTARAIDLAIGERTDGPVFLAADGQRLDRHGAGRIVRKIARRAGIGKSVTPHTLRHAFITAALDAGVPLRDVQEAASHADPRTTMRYDRARGSLDRHATYIVAAYVAGAARSTGIGWNRSAWRRQLPGRAPSPAIRPALADHPQRPQREREPPLWTASPGQVPSGSPVQIWTSGVGIAGRPVSGGLAGGGRGVRRGSGIGVLARCNGQDARGSRMTAEVPVGAVCRYGERRITFGSCSSVKLRSRRSISIRRMSGASWRRGTRMSLSA